MLLKHLEGILNYCRTRVRFGVVEAINGNIRTLINRGRGYKNMRYLLLKARRMSVTNTEYVAFQKIRKAAQNATSYEFLRRALFTSKVSGSTPLSVLRSKASTSLPNERPC